MERDDLKITSDADRKAVEVRFRELARKARASVFEMAEHVEKHEGGSTELVLLAEMFRHLGDGRENQAHKCLRALSALVRND